MGQTAITVDWEGPDSTIQYGTTTAYDRSVTAVQPDPVPYSSAGPFWEARITGLAENTVYHYSIGGGPDHTFRTPLPRGSGGFTVFVEGDIGDASTYPNVAAVQAQIAAGNPTFVLMVGDLAYGDINGQVAVDNHFNDMMVWSQDAAYMPAWGNHEWDESGADDLRNYKGRFDFPNAQTSPGSPSTGCCGEDWYWFDYGNVRFIAYPEPWLGAWPDWNSKAAPLMEAAQNDPAIRFIVTFGHRAAYSSGHHPGLAPLDGYLDALGASYSKYVLNVNAHSHNYERTFHQSGVAHVTVGTGGSGLGQDGDCLWLTCTQPSWSAFRAMRLGTLRLRFTPVRIEGSFICGPPGGGTNDVECEPGTVADWFVIDGSSTDVRPGVAASSSVSGIAGAPITVSVTATDPNGDAITSLAADLSVLPAGSDAAFTPGSGNTAGTFTWTPAAGDARPSPYNITFTASNALASSTATAITVAADQPPIAALSVAPSTGNAPVAVTADASASSDSGGIASYRFDFGDGTIVGPQPEPTAAHTYASAGNWTTRVLVTDNLGATATATASVLAASVDPGANFVANPSFEASTSGWAATGGALLARVSGGFDGGFSLEMRGPATGTAKFGVNDTPNWIASVPAAGTVYRLAAWVRSATAAGKAQIRVREYLGGVQQGAAAFSPDVPLTPNWQRVAMVYVARASGSTLDVQVLDAPVAPGEVLQTDNVSIVQGYTISAVEEEAAAGKAPLTAVMMPNPANPRATLVFRTSREESIHLRLYDTAGRHLRTLLEGATFPAGRHAVPFDGLDSKGRRLSSGVYFYWIETRGESARGRFVVVR